MRSRAALSLVAILLASPAHELGAAAPNIIHILADDLGWGSVGFNGQAAIATPNLDHMAAQGMVFNNSYSATVCGPTRAMLYTGFHQGHAIVDRNGAIGSGFRAEDVMTGQVLQEAGYSTAIYGKWGFGANGTHTIGPAADPAPAITDADSLPSRNGYENFYGYLNHGAAHDYNYDWMWKSNASTPNTAVLEQNAGGPGGEPQYSHDLFAAKSEQYITAHATDADPFYMQVNYTIPHFDLLAIADAPGGYGQYASMPWTTEQKAYAAMISRMDASIGALLAKLEDPNGDGDESDSIAQDTLVMFTSDNGPTPEHTSPMVFFDAAGIYRGGKRDLYEGGIHVPAVAYWPGTISAGTESDYRTDVADFMATVAEIGGVETPVGIDGVSLLPVLNGQAGLRTREFLVFEHHEDSGPDADTRTALWTVIRQDGMKVIRYTNGSSDLFNLATDPGETSPLNLANAGNAQLVADFADVAAAEGAHQGFVEHRTWTGASGGYVEADANWSGTGGPATNWSAVLANGTATPSSATVGQDVATLGFEVRGPLARQTVQVLPGKSISGRNEVRIADGGRVELADATLATNRWVNIREGGELHGTGNIVGDVFNAGQVAPGRSAGAGPLPTPSPPPPLPPANLDTGPVTAVQFNFSGVQDDAPLTQTSALSPYGALAQGFDFGPGLFPRGAANAGDEFNVQGFVIGGTLQDAINNQDYLSFVIEPIDGAGFIPSSVNFRLWRNGANAAQEWAIMSSVDGFTTSDVLAQFSFTDFGSSNQHLLTASFVNPPTVTEPLEVRLYGWHASGGQGNTHVNLASMMGRFVGVPTLAFDFAGVQDGSPLTATTFSSESLSVVNGFSYGPGVSTRHPAGGGTNAGNEFNAAGFSSATSLAAALPSNDYVSFTVQAVDGMAMVADSVSFSLWRQSSASANGYAILSSVDGFAAGEELASATYSDFGAASQHTITATLANAQATEDPVEFRLYGFGAATLQDNTHITGASMRARFVSVVGGSIGPAGELHVSGDFHHLAGSELAIELGGLAAGDTYDVLSVDGAVELAGDLHVSLLNTGGGGFAPQLGDEFTILTATGGLAGEFANVVLPGVAAGLDWRLAYGANAVVLQVLSSADFNQDGTVDGADLAAWKVGVASGGTDKSSGDADNDHDVDGADLLAWQRQLGSNVATSGSLPVPEPTSAVLLLGAIMALRAAISCHRTLR